MKRSRLPFCFGHRSGGSIVELLVQKLARWIRVV